MKFLKNRGWKKVSLGFNGFYSPTRWVKPELESIRIPPFKKYYRMPYAVAIELAYGLYLGLVHRTRQDNVTPCPIWHNI